MPATRLHHRPHLHFAVYNASHVAVDPYGWSPGRYALVWPEGPLEATSRYLWIRPLTAAAETGSSTPQSLLASALARVIVSTAAYSETLRIEWRGLPALSSLGTGACNLFCGCLHSR